MKIEMPKQVTLIIKMLENAGYEAYAVGGCVRDTMIGKKPKDWDLCTSAKPEEMMEVFQEYKTIPTGLNHGTLTVVVESMHLEVTTLRTDGEYEDNRHPNYVKFTSNIEEDLARRDFTINAMAYNDTKGICDPFGGQLDLERRRIRCVGEATTRFREDALRIMRGLRFASELSYEIEPATSKAIHQERGLLLNVAMERINVELSKILLGDGAEEILLKYGDIFSVFMPEIDASFGFEQRNYHHIYDVWKHIVKSVGFAPKNEIIRYALLFHDIGKPKCFSCGEDGVGHFYGHSAVSEELARNILSRLRFDNERKGRILKLIKYHDFPFNGDSRQLKRLMNKLGAEDVCALLEVKRADTLGQAPGFHSTRLALIDDEKKLLQKILDEKQCFSLENLDISGRDLIDKGICPGPEVGRMLRVALDGVITGQVPNKKYEILRFLDKSNKK